jgi:hypothetical protein
MNTQQSTKKGKIEVAGGVTAAVAMVVSWGLTHYFQIEDGEQLSMGIAVLIVALTQMLVGKHNIKRDETKE